MKTRKTNNASLLVLRTAALCFAFTALLPACRSVPRNDALGESAELKMAHGNRERIFRLYQSPANSARTGKLPLIIALHGGGGDAESMEKLTAYGFNRIADRDGALVVYPQGIGKHWNCGRMIENSEAHEEGGAPVKLMMVFGGGHTWPGGWPYLARVMIGRTSRDFDACEVIWEFFRSNGS